MTDGEAINIMRDLQSIIVSPHEKDKKTVYAIQMGINALKRSGWISVKNRPPKEHDSIFAKHTHLSKHMWEKESDFVNVYVEFSDGTGRVTEGRLQDGKWWTRISPALNPVVTHWMPLPEPPKEET